MLINLVYVALVVSTTNAAYNQAQLSPIRIESRSITWQTLARLSDPSNWEPQQRMPCHRDRVILPEWWTVYLDVQLEARELVMPANGIVVLGPEGGIRLATQDFHNWQYACAEDGLAVDMFFKPHRLTGETWWYDQTHWLLAFQQSFAQNTRGRVVSSYATFMHHRAHNRAHDSTVRVVPHYERIPCAHDRIFLPTNGSFRVSVHSNVWAPEPALVTVGAERRLADVMSMVGFVMSMYGKLMFNISTNDQVDHKLSGLEYGGESTLVSGSGSSPLVCDNGRPSSSAMICAFVVCDAESLECRDPIQPWGFCCPICAASLLVQTKPRKTGKLDSMFDRIENVLSLVNGGDVLRQVQFYLHWLDDQSALQLVVANLPDARPETGREFLEMIKFYLLTAQLEYNMVYQASTDWIRLDSGGHALLVFLMLCLIASMCLVVVYFYYHHNRLDPAFTFVRFRSTGDDIELETPANLSDHVFTSTRFKETPRSLRNSGQVGQDDNSPVVLESLDITKIPFHISGNAEPVSTDE